MSNLHPLEVVDREWVKNIIVYCSVLRVKYAGAMFHVESYNVYYYSDELHNLH